MSHVSYTSYPVAPQQAVNLTQENARFCATGGISQENQHLQFRPAFMDRENGDIELSRFGNGNPAPFHSLDGLPESWIVERNIAGRATAIKSSVVSGFVRLGRFFTREQAAAFVDQCAS